MHPPSERVLCLLSRWRIDLAWGVLLLLPFSRPTATTIAAGLPIVGMGIALRLWARGHLERGSTVSTGGPYAFVRHPLYVGSFCIAVGFAWMTGVGIMPFLAGVAFLVMYVPKAMREEAHLRRRFGERYASYTSQVGAVLPSWPMRSANRFAWRRVMRQGEWKTWLGTAAFLAAMCVLAAVHRPGGHASWAPPASRLPGLMTSWAGRCDRWGDVQAMRRLPVP